MVKIARKSLTTDHVGVHYALCYDNCAFFGPSHENLKDDRSAAKYPTDYTFRQYRPKAHAVLAVRL